MRTSTTASTTTRCDYENSTADRCDAFLLCTYTTLTPERGQAGHLRSLAADGWWDLEGRDYCPGCPPDLPFDGHDHEGLWAVDPDETTP
ncbi:hypothetical protein [Streptomyces bacillaris]|uniref:hypothetical protein n=1 Tax=Streptomyces bacillaris TaxID=68179 RepID=UPI00381A24EA